MEPPDFTNPESSATFFTQSAVHNSLAILEEMVALLEQDEADQLKREVEKRRTRLGAAGPEQLRKEVGREIWSTSKVRMLRVTWSTMNLPSRTSFPPFTTRS